MHIGIFQLSRAGQEKNPDTMSEIEAERDLMN